MMTLVQRIGDLLRLRSEFERDGKHNLALYVTAMIADAEAELRSIRGAAANQNSSNG
jgi:hypothetical protein